MGEHSYREKKGEDRTLVLTTGSRTHVWDDGARAMAAHYLCGRRGDWGTPETGGPCRPAAQTKSDMIASAEGRLDPITSQGAPPGLSLSEDLRTRPPFGFLTLGFLDFGAFVEPLPSSSEARASSMSSSSGKAGAG